MGWDISETYLAPIISGFGYADADFPTNPPMIDALAWQPPRTDARDWRLYR
jgi:hypothetical protein